MRPSKLLHPVAVLRKIIPLGQKELADLVDCSADTIQSIELLRMPLTEDLAERIGDATGVDVAWLLQGDPKVEPIDDLWMPYDRTAFEGAEDRRKPGSLFLQCVRESFTQEEANKVSLYYAQRLAKLILKAAHIGKLRLVQWQINRAIHDLEDRYEKPREPKTRRRKKKK